MSYSVIHREDVAADVTTPGTRFTVDLAEINHDHVHLTGGKAASLGVLLSLGFDVPDGYVVTTETFQRCMASAGLLAQDGISLLDSVAPEELRERILNCDIPADVWHDIRARHSARFGVLAPPLAIRSSGLSEDSAEASFAGQFETILNVLGFDNVISAIRRCWASQLSASAAAYRKNRGISAIEPIAVIVQRFVDATTSGVLFTVNPVSGNEGEYLVEAAFGVGEALLDGAVDADRYVLDAASGTVKQKNIAAKKTLTVSGMAGVRRITATEGVATRETLMPADIGHLATAGRRLQEYYGRPMDIEWAISDGTLKLLQARPVTAIHFAGEWGQWTTADFRDGGVSSSVCSPFMWSLYRRAFQFALPRFMRKIRIRKDADSVTWIRLFFGRPYWNLGQVKKTLERLPGYRERDFHHDLGIAWPGEAEGIATPIRLSTILRAIPLLCGIWLAQRRCLAHDRKLRTGFDRDLRRFSTDPAILEALDDTTFAKLFAQLLEFQFLVETSYFETIFNTSVARIAFGEVLKSVERKAPCAADLRALLGGLRDLSHGRAWKDLFQIYQSVGTRPIEVSPDFVADFAARWPHHGRKELDITVVRWPHDLDLLGEQIRSSFDAFANGRDPLAAEEGQHERFVAERQRILNAIGRHRIIRWRFLKALKRARSYAWWREEMRDCSSQVYAVLRIWCLEAGQRLQRRGALTDPEEIWALHLEDVVVGLTSRLELGMLRAQVARGLRLIAAFRNFDPPHEIGLPDAAEPRATAARDITQRLQGIPCSSGRILARVRVARDLESAQRLEEGEILVTAFTDPGWTLLFSKLGGVITETGGILSHAAVISREFGIPAVLGVSGAIELIADGCWVAMDGSTGVIEIVAEG